MRLTFYINGKQPIVFESTSKSGLLRIIRSWIDKNLMATRHLNGSAPVKSLAFVLENGRMETLKYDIRLDGWSIGFTGMTMTDFSPNYRNIRDMFLLDAQKVGEPVSNA